MRRASQHRRWRRACRRSVSCTATRVTDDYAWMRDPDDPAFREYLAAERAYYDAESRRLQRTGRHAGGRGRRPDPDRRRGLGQLAAGRIHVSHEDARRTATTSSCCAREPGSISEQVLLDENLIADETGFAEVGVREPSPDGALLAWSADTSGAEIYELRIRDLRTGEDLPEVIARTLRRGGLERRLASTCSISCPTSSTGRFRCGATGWARAATADELVLEEPDQRFELTLHGSRSGELAIITAESRDTTEVRRDPAATTRWTIRC